MAWRPMDAESRAIESIFRGSAQRSAIGWLLYRDGYADAFREAEPDSEELPGGQRATTRRNQNRHPNV